MNPSDNKAILKTVFDALAEGNSRPFVDSMAEEFRWTMAGESQWSRTYDGKAAVMDQLFPLLRARIEGRTRTIAQRFIADGDLVVVEARGANMAKDGRPYRNHYCFVFRLAGGKLVELTEYMDTEMAITVLGAPPA
ncbi:nuclear transport factor 2 family protein [Phreatobacter stygius]|uniref:Nuclear transport factor 2 family protein n=1 Tax=Phreatobacter stygius TaxID=1940610 RepID=A0A4D7B740_9HYPH|nr:nuclear transport factor 2 family protein [Phreatobacter stygius]QCI66733.1 nuclear transport factor 2 family protein [Phreatobacter stygius]